MMKRIASLFTLFLCVATVALAQFQTPVTIKASQNKVSDDVLEVVFRGTVDAGWHVYGTDFADGGPTRAELTLETQKGVKPDGKLRAVGNVQKKMDEMFGMEVSYMEGTAEFVQRFVITEPEYEVSGYLTYGACNDENCMPPTNVEFNFKGEGKKMAAVSEPKTNETKPEEPAVVEEDTIAEAPVPAVSTTDKGNEFWTPVIDELKAFEVGTQTTDKSLLGIFLL
ncbi:MAG: protein-disulfide reductase DsbD family protein, partial [Bacteroidaceae bacterium]|nr:protein-disulfide reductase DsbD family protein [Bacteroidaceae bacterium]